MGYLRQGLVQKMGTSLCVLHRKGFNRGNLVLAKLLEELKQWLRGWSSPRMAPSNTEVTFQGASTTEVTTGAKPDEEAKAPFIAVALSLPLEQ